MVAAIPGKSALYIGMLSLHGLVRGSNLELGRDSDTGGQVTYVLEMAQALSRHKDVARVDVFTRQIFDPRIDLTYSLPQEQIEERAWIIRVPFGPRRYLKKESLWPFLEVFLDTVPAHFKSVGRVPDVIHGHYADAGLAGVRLANILGVPFVFTGHSLGIEKQRLLRDSGMSDEKIEAKYNISRRIRAEERALAGASMVVASTRQEADVQYADYPQHDPNQIKVIPPGVDLRRFRPPRRGDPTPQIYLRAARFLREPRKPWILALARADPKKNLNGLIKAYGTNLELREKANLVIAVGHRDSIQEMDRDKRQVLTQMLVEIDHYDLYGHAAYPKQQVPEDVPAYYRVAAQTGGVFVNPALTEPFGLTLLEAAASGLPLIATNDGGPRDILGTCKNGLLIDPLDPEAIAAAILHALNDQKTWRTWSANGVRLSHRHYTWEGHVETYIRNIKRIVHRPPPGMHVAKIRLPTLDRLLISDIDNTLLGDRQALAELFERLNSADARIGFGIATGRRLESAQKILQEWKVPKVDLFITAVGTQIHYGPRAVEDNGWPAHISYRWDRDVVEKTLQGMPGLKLQPETEQLPHKVSYFVDESLAPSMREIEKKLRQQGVSVNVVYSHEEYLDILPIRASKGDAVRYLAFKWGLPMERVLVAGDSGNDAEMLAGNALGVVVGNYSPELEQYRGADRLYFANGHYARGILEGIDHYDFLGTILIPDEEKHV